MITNIWLGNDAKEKDADKWDIYYSGSTSSLSCSIDATGYDYIRFRVRRMGTASAYETLDGVPEVEQYLINYLDANGKPCAVGGTIYGWLYDFVFEIPQGSASSIAKFRYIDTGIVPMKIMEAIANITWA